MLTKTTRQQLTVAHIAPQVAGMRETGIWGATARRRLAWLLSILPALDVKTQIQIQFKDGQLASVCRAFRIISRTMTESNGHLYYIGPSRKLIEDMLK